MNIIFQEIFSMRHKKHGAVRHHDATAESQPESKSLLPAATFNATKIRDYVRANPSALHKKHKGLSALVWAIKKGKFELAEELVRLGSDVGCYAPYIEWSREILVVLPLWQLYQSKKSDVRAYEKHHDNSVSEAHKLRIEGVHKEKSKKIADLYCTLLQYGAVETHENYVGLAGALMRHRHGQERPLVIKLLQVLAKQDFFLTPALLRAAHSYVAYLLSSRKIYPIPINASPSKSIGEAGSDNDQEALYKKWGLDTHRQNMWVRNSSQLILQRLRTAREVVYAELITKYQATKQLQQEISESGSMTPLRDVPFIFEKVRANQLRHGWSIEKPLLESMLSELKKSYQIPPIIAKYRESFFECIKKDFDWGATIINKLVFSLPVFMALYLGSLLAGGIFLFTGLIFLPCMIFTAIIVIAPLVAVGIRLLYLHRERKKGEVDARPVLITSQRDESLTAGSQAESGRLAFSQRKIAQSERVIAQNSRRIQLLQEELARREEALRQCQQPDASDSEEGSAESESESESGDDNNDCEPSDSCPFRA